MGYSSFLVMSGKDKPMAAKEEREGGSDPLTGSPVSNDLYKQNLLDSFSQRRGHQQRGVLSYKSVTPRPSASRELIKCHKHFLECVWHLNRLLLGGVC